MSRSWPLTLADSCVAFGLVLAVPCPRPCPSWRFSQTLDVHVHDSCSYLDQCGEPHADVSEDSRLHRPWLGHPRIISHHLHVIGKKTRQRLASSPTQPSSLSFPSDPIVSPAFPNVPSLPLLILPPSNKENTKTNAYEVKREINCITNRIPIPFESQIVASGCWFGPMVKSYQAETR